MLFYSIFTKGVYSYNKFCMLYELICKTSFSVVKDLIDKIIFKFDTVYSKSMVYLLIIDLQEY